MPELNRDQFSTVNHPVKEHPGGFFRKDKPGTQGQLVTGGQAQAWPRGFSPQRRGEVVGALQDVSFDHSRWPHWGKRGDRDEAKMDRFVEEDGSYPEPDPSRDPDPARTWAKNRFTEDIARSTVPTKDLEGVSRVGYDTHALGRDAGLYEPPGNLHLHSEADESVAVHELGHHVSERSGNAHSASRGYGASFTPGHTDGIEEGYAQNYAQEHTRDRKGQTLPTPSYQDLTNEAEDWVGSASSSDSAASFHTAYRSTRQNVLSPDQFGSGDTGTQLKMEI